MASVSVEITTRASPAQSWDAVRDVGALHTRLVPGFVVDTALIPGGRRVTFTGGRVVDEPIIDCNDQIRRLVWTLVYGQSPITHYNSAVQVFAHETGGSRLLWTTDVLPHEAAAMLKGLMQQGAAAMTAALDKIADA